MSAADKITNDELIAALASRLQLVGRLKDAELIEEIEDRPGLIDKIVQEHCDCSEEVLEALEEAQEVEPDGLVERFESLMASSLPAERDDLMQRIGAIAARFGARAL